MHTPGPWSVVKGEGIHAGHSVVVAPHAGMKAYTPLAILSSVLDDEEPDARLIAAAPDLLKELKSIAVAASQKLDADGFEAIRSEIDSAFAAIAKATK